MFFGEHLNANEQEIKCPCGVTATVNVLEQWLCRRCAGRQQEKLAKAVASRRSR
jgi:hypothetical protein